jgi:hypothetical protein
VDVSAKKPGSATDSAASPMVLAMRKVVVMPRRELSVSRHVMRDEVVYVVRDPISFETHAFGGSDYALLTALNGDRTLREAFPQDHWQGAIEHHRRPLAERVASWIKAGAVLATFAGIGVLLAWRG